MSHWKRNTTLIFWNGRSNKVVSSILPFSFDQKTWASR